MKTTSTLICLIAFTLTACSKGSLPESAEAPHRPVPSSTTALPPAATQTPAASDREQLLDAVAALRRGETPAAVATIKRLADKGLADAQLEYGLILWKAATEGRREEAVRWFQKAADQGHLIAMHNLGHAYWTGEGVERSDSLGDFWMLKAAKGGLARSQGEIGRRAINRNEFESARQWLELGADQGDAQSKYNLAKLLEDALGGPRDEQRAADLYREAAMQGHDLATANLGAMYMDGRGERRNHVEAAKWFLIAKEYGLKTAEINLKQIWPRLGEAERELAYDHARETFARIQGTQR